MWREPFLFFSQRAQRYKSRGGLCVNFSLFLATGATVFLAADVA